jgi:hypothetical protein
LSLRATKHLILPILHRLMARMHEVAISMVLIWIERLFMLMVHRLMA